MQPHLQKKLSNYTEYSSLKPRKLSIIKILIIFFSNFIIEQIDHVTD